MLFNSISFALFLPIVFLLYWFLFNRKRLVLRNLFLLVVSYFFYGSWDWRFLSLIFISSLLDFLVGNSLHKYNEIEASHQSDLNVLKGIRSKKKILLGVSVISNIGLLGFFKYFNFFAESLVDLFKVFNVNLATSTLDIILPVGISFYTFQTLSYTIDIYRKQLKPANGWIQFFAFVSFFPQLVAGPIERAKNLLPQFETLKEPNYALFRSALLLISWGFFKKIMIADRIAVLVDSAYADPSSASGFPMILAVLFFAFQLYLDFSAYSDIAKGTAALFGFNLINNFNRPYLATSFSNFWKRWHISLSSWFMDYVYIPLGGNRNGKFRTYLNSILVFAISGLWHGASWNFVLWGLLNVFFLLVFDPLLRFNVKNKADLTKNHMLVHLLKSFFIVSLWALSLIFFRADTFDVAIETVVNLGFNNVESISNFGLNQIELRLTFYLLLALLVKEILWEWKGDEIHVRFFRMNGIVRWAFYTAFILFMIYFGHYGSGNEHSFIYFQF